MATIKSTGVIAAALLLGCGARVQATDLYTWKDARGVTHYADAPPRKGAFSTRAVQAGDAATPAEAPAPAVSPNADCTVAKANLDKLKAGGVIGLDADHDGKPDAAMTPTELQQQRDLAERQILVFCTPKGAVSAP